MLSSSGALLNKSLGCCCVAMIGEFGTIMFLISQCLFCNDIIFPLGGKTRCAFDRSTVRRSYKRKTQETGKLKETVATRPSVMFCPCSLDKDKRTTSANTGDRDT